MNNQSTDPTSITVRIITDYDQFLLLQPVWNKLNNENNSSTIYQTFEFNLTWWNSFGKDCSLQILLAEQNNKVVCIFPLMKSEDGLTRFLGHPNFDFHDLIGTLDSNSCSAFVKHIIKNRLLDNGLELSQLSERSTSLSLLKKEFENRSLPMKVAVVENCLALDYSGTEDKRLEFILRKGRNFKKAVNFYKPFGGHQLQKIDDLEVGLNILRQLFQLHISRWKGSSTPSKFEQKVHRDFHLELLKTLWPSGSIVLMAMTAGELPICYSFNFEFNGSIYHYTLAYNNFLFKRSPGTFFFTSQSEHFIQQGYNLDFGRGTQGYKKEIATESYDSYEIVIFGGGVRQFKNKVRDAFKSFPPIKKLVSNQKFQRFRDGLSRKLTTGGITGLFGSYTKSLVNLIIKNDSAMLYSLDKENYRTRQTENNILVSEISKTDLPLLGTFAGMIDESPSYKELTQRLQDGDRAFIATEDNMIVGSGWISEQNIEIPKLGKQLTILPNEIGLYDLLFSELTEQTDQLEALLGAVFDAVVSHRRTRIRTFASNENKKLNKLLVKSQFVSDGSSSRLSLFGS